MTVVATHRTDAQVKEDVEIELTWRPEIDAASIGVAAHDGTVLLTGEVPDYSQLVAVKDAVLRVRGVQAIVNELTVPNPEGSPTEQQLGENVAHALAIAVDVPKGVQAEVRQGTVILTGEVAFDVQRRAAKRAVRSIRGVRSVDNRIQLRRKASADDAAARIESALRRNAILDAHSIHVSLEGDVLTLAGEVRSWAERREAGRAAAASPHVARVDNHLIVQPLG